MLVYQISSGDFITYTFNDTKYTLFVSEVNATTNSVRFFKVYNHKLNKMFISNSCLILQPTEIKLADYASKEDIEIFLNKCKEMNITL